MLSAAVLILLWALLRNIPVVAADSLLAERWTRAGKALMSREFITIGRLCLGIFLFITGVQHFIFTDFVASLIPNWFPGNAVWWTRFAGVALLAGGVGLLVPFTAAAAALLSGMMVFSWVWIMHVPRTFASVSDNIAVFEALAVSGIAFVIAGFLLPRRFPPR